MCFLRLLTVLCTSEFSFLSDIDVRNPDEKSIMTYIAQFLQYSNDLPIADDEFEVRQTPTESLLLVSASAFLPLFILSLFLFLTPFTILWPFNSASSYFLSPPPGWMQLQTLLFPTCLSPVNLPTYFTPAVLASPIHKVRTSQSSCEFLHSFLSKYNSSISFYLFQHAFWFSNQSRIRFYVSCPALRLHPVRKSERWNAG